jgi:hypothetical protein
VSKVFQGIQKLADKDDVNKRFSLIDETVKRMYEFIRAKAAMMRHSMGSENMDEHQGSSKK